MVMNEKPQTQFLPQRVASDLGLTFCDLDEFVSRKARRVTSRWPYRVDEHSWNIRDGSIAVRL